MKPITYIFFLFNPKDGRALMIDDVSRNSFRPSSWQNKGFRQFFDFHSEEPSQDDRDTLEGLVRGKAIEYEKITDLLNDEERLNGAERARRIENALKEKWPNLQIQLQHDPQPDIATP